MKGFSGVPGNLQALMKQAQKMQSELQKAQEEAQQFKAEASAGGGMVKAVASGKNRLESITIEKEVINPNDADMLQDLILAAVNEALEKVQENTKEHVGKITGGLNLPGLS